MTGNGDTRYIHRLVITAYARLLQRFTAAFKRRDNRFPLRALSVRAFAFISHYIHGSRDRSRVLAD